MKYIDKEIKFNNVKGTGINLNTGLPIFSRKYKKDNDGNIIFNKPIINAIDIDWNAAQLQNNEINTTGDLLNIIKDLQNKINILNEKVFNNTIEYNDPTEFCIESIDNDVYISGNRIDIVLEYSFDRITWDYIGYRHPIYLEKNKKLYIRGNNQSCDVTNSHLIDVYNNINNFYNYNDSQNLKIEISGNIMSLLYKEDFNNKYIIPSASCFSDLFSGCEWLYKADNLLLPATILTEYCYRKMFAGCTSLINTPELPATTLTNNCYQDMFRGCTSLINPPKLPATILAPACYYSMFSYCTNLTITPELPVTILSDYCYNEMFVGCTSLTIASELPATQLVEGCYRSMFKDCTSLQYIKILAINSINYSTNDKIFNNIFTDGIFVKNIEAQWDNEGIVPQNWTVIYHDTNENKYYLDQNKEQECDNHGNII